MAAANWTGSEIMMGLADRSGPDMTARLLLALTALYSERPVHTTEQRQQYVELALRLIDKVDQSTRATVAEILRNHPFAPTEVWERVAPALSGAPRSASATRTIGIEPSPARSAPADGEAAAATPTAGPLGAGAPAVQPAPAAADIAAAFFPADAAERRRLLSLIAAGSDAEELPPVPVAEGDGAADTTAEPETASQRYGGLDAAAMEGRIGEFIREFERVLGIPKSLCERILNDSSGEPVVIAAKAANMPIAVLQRILLLVNPAVSHSVQRVYDLTDLFHAIDRNAAARLMSLWRGQARAEEVDAKPPAAERKPLAARDLPSGGLRSRFGALAARVAAQNVNARVDPGNAGRGDLRFR